MARSLRIATCDCETDPFLQGRVPHPFLWCYYDGVESHLFTATEAFVTFVRTKRIILYAHNGGKFDFVYLLQYVGKTKVQIINGRMVSLKLGKCELRDSFAIMPTKLAELGAKKQIEHWKLEVDVRKQHWQEICDYCRQDCVVLYDAVTMYREAAGKQKTIAGNALRFSRKLGIDVGKTSNRFDTNFRCFYYGGRTQCLKSGRHDNLTLLDIRSAYPYAMTHDHATGSQFTWRDNLNGLTDSEIARAFIVMECDAQGCFPVRGEDQGLSFPHDRRTYYVTGWEYLAARDVGLISNVRFISVRTTDATVTFDSYVQYWYAEKQRFNKITQPAKYYIAKTMMNSLYGKLAQNPARYYDYEIKDAGSTIDRNNGWELAQEYDVFEIHRRSALWKTQAKFGDNWIAKPLYYNVATGASITGFVRAYLLRAFYRIGIERVVYCDTDSLMVRNPVDLSAFDLSNRIGGWELEDSNAWGYFSGKKQYALRLSNGKVKIANKGAQLTFANHKALCEGQTIIWRNAAPTFNMLSAINSRKKKRQGIDEAAKFVVRRIRQTAA